MFRIYQFIDLQYFRLRCLSKIQDGRFQQAHVPLLLTKSNITLQVHISTNLILAGGDNGFFAFPTLSIKKRYSNLS